MATKKPENPDQAPKWFRDFITKQFNPLVELVEQDHKLLMKVIKLNNLKIN